MHMRGCCADSSAAGTTIASWYAVALFQDWERRMLKVTTMNEAEVTRLVVEGRLVDPETTELLHAWLRARAADPRKSIEADLSGVTYADRAATGLLAKMSEQGARLIGTGVMTRSLIDQATDGAGARAGPIDQEGRSK